MKDAFLIKDINKLAKTSVCTNCQARFTKVCYLQQHTKTCTQGQTIIDCPNKKVELPLTAYERVFYPFHKQQISASVIHWLERTSNQLKKHIHHALCGHGGERWLLGALVDGYDLTTNTVFQYHSCHWHGCQRCFSNERDNIINHNQTHKNRFLATAERTRRLRAAGHHVIEMWECDDKKTRQALPKKEKKTYPHAIFYDFESYQDKTKKNKVTASLTYENAHVPISVSIGDTLEREPTHVCNANPKELILKFVKGLERRGKNIRAEVRAEFMPEDIGLIPGKQWRAIVEWCDQVPVLGFNCGRYDLNLIKEHFAELLADTTAKVQVGKKANTTMFMKTNGSRFVDIINYLGPGTSYEK